MTNKILIFEGAGWDKAEHNGVGNCRIRTIIENKEGRNIYLECNGHESNNFKGFVSHCFDMIDKKINHTKDLCAIEHLKFNYTPQDLIKFVNENLNCDFDSLIVDNDNLRVHDSDKPLCSCKVV